MRRKDSRPAALGPVERDAGTGPQIASQATSPA
jgi:hypothetical protein